MYKVYINHAELRIAQQRDQQAYAVYDCRDSFDWKRLYEQLKRTEQHRVYNVVCAFPEDAFAEFASHFTSIDAAGGLVTNQSGELLMIRRLGKWDLPKGKMENGENPPDTALREVEEECGINQLTIKHTQAFITYHTYELNQERILKRTFWYGMQSGFSKQLVPQKEEGITKVEWVSPDETLEEKLRNTYQNIIDVIRALG